MSPAAYRVAEPAPLRHTRAMERNLRERRSVGRRTVRRRKRRAFDGPSEAHVDAGEDDGFEADAAEPDGEERGPFDVIARTALARIPANPFDDVDDERAEDAPPAGGGFFAFFTRLFAPKPSHRGERADGPPGDDPVRAVLAVPRGPARLDAFEEALADLAPSSHGQRVVALAFHRELCALADRASVDLSLLEARVEACARALMDAGDAERAGKLLSRIGRRHQAAEMFVAAGAIDELEELHARIAQDEGGPRLRARLSYERFEALFLVARRKEALLALREAVSLWRENLVYGEILQTFEGRLLPRGRATLRTGTTSLLLEQRWPIVIGRGEDAAVRVASPLVSRAHLTIELDAGVAVVRDLESRGGTRVDGEALAGRRALGDEGRLDMAGVVVCYARRGEALLLWAELTPTMKTLALTGGTVHVPDVKGEPAFHLWFDEDGAAHAMPGDPVSVGDVPVHQPLLLLHGDRVVGPGFLWHIARS